MKLTCITQLTECVGKTIAGADQDGEFVLIRFTDDTILALRSECEEGCECWAHAQSWVNLESKSVRRAALRCGAITKWKFDDLNKHSRDRTIAQRREQYESLRKEFEGK